MKYAKGQSGNPKGRPRGVADKRVELRSLLEPHAAELVRTVVELAKAGDGAALRLCLDRLIPTLKARDEPVGSMAGTIGVASLSARPRVMPQ